MSRLYNAGDRSSVGVIDRWELSFSISEICGELEDETSDVHLSALNTRAQVFAIPTQAQEEEVRSATPIIRRKSCQPDVWLSAMEPTQVSIPSRK